MSDNTYKPAGYCPHCGYAIDPGVCPECGKNVAADELDSAPYWVTRRRIVKRAVLALVILSLAIGGWYVYARCNWIAWVPTRVLLSFQGARDSRSTIELGKRFMTGKLSQSQLAALITNAVAPVSRLTFTDNCPCDVRVPVQPQINAMRLPAGIWIHGVDWQARVDGKPAKLVRRGVVWRHPYDVSFLLPAMFPGTHEVDLQGALQVGGASTVLATNIPLTLHGQVTVSASHLVNHVKLQWSPQLADRIRGSATAWSGRWRLYPITGPEIASSVRINLSASSVPLIARIEVRPTGQERYVPQTSNGAPRIEVIEPSRDQQADGISVRPLNADKMDIRLVPDPEEAYRLGFAECLSAVIEWHGVPVFRTDATSQPASSTSDRSGVVIMPPTLVYQATTTKTSE